MKKHIFHMLMLFPCLLWSTEVTKSATLSLEVRGGLLIMRVDNHGDDDIEINRRFAVDSTPIGDVLLDISGGKKDYPIAVNNELIPPERFEDIVLHKNQFYGSSVDLREIKNNYYLSPGCYRVSGFFKLKDRSLTPRSNIVKMCIK